MGSRPHPVIAGICDFYIIGMIYGAIAALAGSIAQKVVPIGLSLVILIINIIMVIIYHKVVSRRVRFLSPGERITGRVWRDDGKIWTNPYGISRWALFAIIILDLLIYGNTWDGIGEGIYPLFQIGLKIFALSLLCLGVILMGKGKVVGAVFPIIGFIGSFAQLLLSDSPYQNVAGLFLILGALNALVLIIYQVKRKRFTEMET